MTSPIRLMIVDDSFFMRKALEKIFAGAGNIVICEAVSTGEAAIEKLESANPDIITMDVEMPGMGGLAAVRAIMARRRLPILMLSSLTTRGAEATLRALEYGAADFVAKPSGGMTEIASIANEMVAKVRALVQHPVPVPVQPKIVVAAGDAPPQRASNAVRPGHIECIAMGVSTGGPAALASIFARLPAAMNVPMLIVQHMPPGFTKPLAERLNSSSPLEIVEASDGMSLKPGRVIIGQAGKHLRLRRTPTGTVVRLDDKAPTDPYCPSVDVLMRSLADVYGRSGLAFIMTGMGSDGTAGLSDLKRAGGFVYGQDEQSSTVYGMPRAAADAGLVDRIIGLDEVVDALMDACRR